jgi:predicted SprT family Zn-dependent metalloprotease
MLTSWAADSSLGTAAREALRLDGEPAQLTVLISQWAAGDFSGLPPIEVLEGSVLPGAAGAYAISTGTIYLNRDWLDSASEDRVIAVLTEELGHHLDGILHDQNSHGHKQVAGQHLTTDISAIAKSPKIPVLSPRRTRKEYLNSSTITAQCRNSAPVSWREACRRDRSIAYLFESKKTNLSEPMAVSINSRMPLFFKKP